jgi:glycosyltransferase involved in cell wall biosynthesis
MKIAVVTPYCREDPQTLRRCIDSVRAQTLPCIHYLVADGNPNPLILASTATLRHLVLPVAHGDFGGVARVLGSLAAARDGCDAVAWLDADNWYRPDHLESLRQCHEATGKPLCASWRSMHRPDGSLMPIDPEQEIRGDHVDTNCWLVTRPAFDLLTVWLMPPGLSVIGDRIFFEAARRRGYGWATTRRRTVCYSSLYLDHYQRLKETPPPGAKSGVLQAGLDYLVKPSNRAAIVAALGFMPHGRGPQHDGPETGSNGPAAPSPPVATPRAT